VSASTEITVRHQTDSVSAMLRNTQLSYYGQFSASAMYPVLRHFNKTLVAWAMRLKGHKKRACLFLEGIAKRQPQLFAHWQRRMIGAFA
jgi:RNA-directed DNA polymerase